MAVAGNKVLDGEFKGMYISNLWGRVSICLDSGLFKKPNRIELDYNTVARYQLIDQSSDVSMTSALARSAVGQAVAGDAGGIAGAMTAKVHGVNIVLITYRDGRKSLIEIDDLRYELLKQNCKYNIKLNNDEFQYKNFDIYKEIKCPHCGSIVHGYAEEKCPICKRLYSMPKKEWRTIDIITIPILIFCFPIGLIMMWVNKSYYPNTRVIVTILCGILFIAAICIGTNNSKNISESSGMNNNIVIEDII